MVHRTFQGGMTAISGGKFWSGFAAGAISSIVASSWGGGNANQWQGLGGNFAHSDIGTIAFGTVSGGAAAKLTGGNFWQGAVTGLFVSALNHVATKMDDGASLKIRKDIVDGAEAELNSTEYAVENNNGLFGDPKNKCNLFVSDVLSEADASPGTPNGRLGLSPPSAGQWADSNYSIDNWKVVSSPRAGDVVARARNYTNATGHVAIMDSKSSSIGAGHSVVHRTDFGYGKSHLNSGESYVYRRYYATPQQRFDYQFYNWVNTKRK